MTINHSVSFKARNKLQRLAELYLSRSNQYEFKFIESLKLQTLYNVTEIVIPDRMNKSDQKFLTQNDYSVRLSLRYKTYLLDTIFWTTQNFLRLSWGIV